MDKQQYKQAVKEAKRIIGWLSVSDGKVAGLKISKAQALKLFDAAEARNYKTVRAEWADDEHIVLFVG